jgi:hypothetical protein
MEHMCADKMEHNALYQVSWILTKNHDSGLKFTTICNKLDITKNIFVS